MKYKLAKNTKEVNGITLFQIQSLKDFGNVKKGNIGGWIAKEDNLSQEGNAWVYGDAKVFSNAKVCGNAEVCGNAWVFGDAKVAGNAKVYGDAEEESKKEIKSEYICEDDFQRIISGDVNEVIVDGVKYKKVTQTITSWRKIS